MKRIAILFIIFGSFMVSAAAYALEFSADIVSMTREGSFKGKMYVDDKKVRMEVAGTVTITRMDKNVAWILMPGQNMYMEQPINPNTVVSTTEKVLGELERTALGDDTFEGRACAKYRVTYDAAGNRVTMLQWIDKASGIPLKTQAEDGSWLMEYRNLSIGPQAGSLFEIPSGYKRFAMPSMKDMAEAMQQ